MKAKPARPSQKVQTSFGVIEIAHIDDAVEFSQKYDWKGKDEKWLITGGAKPYEVNLINQTCTCPDVIFRHRTCKHTKAMNFFMVHGML